MTGTLAPGQHITLGEWDYATFRAHSDYSSAGTTVTSYSIQSPIVADPSPDDWLYLIHLNYAGGSPAVEPTLPTGWQNVVPTQRQVNLSGIEWSIWRRPYGGGGGVTVNMSGTRFARATLMLVRPPAGTLPVISQIIGPRAPANPSWVNAPGAVVNTSALYIVLQHTSTTVFTQPPGIVGPASPWYTSPATDNNLFISLAQSAVPVTNTSAVTFQWSKADIGEIGAVTLNFIRASASSLQPPPILYPWPSNSNVFFCDADQYFDGVITLFGGTFTPGTATVYRVNQDNSYFVVRGGQSFRVQDDFVLSDTEAPFDVESRYILDYTPDTRAVFHNWFKNPSFENGATTWSTGSTRTISMYQYSYPDDVGRSQFADISGYSGPPIFGNTDRQYNLVHDRIYQSTSVATLAQRILLHTKPDSGIVWTAGKDYEVSGRVLMRPSPNDWAGVRSDPPSATAIGAMTAPPARTWSDPFFGGTEIVVDRTNLANNPRAVDTGVISGWMSNADWGTGATGVMSYATISDGPAGTGLGAVRRKQWTSPSVAGLANTGMRVVLNMSGTTEQLFPVTSGTTYTVSAYMRHTSVQDKQFLLISTVYDGMTNLPPSQSIATVASPTATVPKDQWHRISVVVNVPAGGKSIRIATEVSSQTDLWKTGEKLEVTGLMIEEGTVVQEYFDGATALGTSTRWVSVVNDSISEMYSTYTASRNWADILGYPSGDVAQGSLYLGLTDSSGVALPGSTLIKVLDIAPPGPTDYVNFRTSFTIPAGMPLGDVNIAFYQGDGTRTEYNPDTGYTVEITDPEEFYRIWSFDSLMLDYKPTFYYGLDYFDGETPMPTDRFGIGYDIDRDVRSWAWDSGDASIKWLGTKDNSASEFIGATQLGAYISGCILQSRTAINGHNLCEPVFLSDPIIPRYSEWLGLLGIGALAWDPRRELFDVLGRHPPVAQSQFRATPHAEFRFITTTLEEREQFITIINTGRILLLRNPDPKYPETMWYVSVGTVSEERIATDHRNPHRRWVVDMQVVDRPSGLLTALTGQSWQVVRDTHIDWADVQAKNDNWIEVLMGSSQQAVAAGATTVLRAAPTLPTVQAASNPAAWLPVL